ncbi:MAG TPA: hypothetical protein VKI44_31240 [Acetobacteraceae bacterium]|nr:hypothetical protein [Acetobacteraceae bacterium]
MLARLSLVLLLLLASCGDLPEPFIGNPGAMGRLLAQPPTPRLAVPTPGNALLPDGASRQFASSLAAGLQAEEVPAFADRVRANDWQLVATAEQRGPNVVPLFHVLNPKGEDKGDIEGSPVPTQAWAAATLAMLDQTARDAAPKISNLLTGIQHADPNSLYNRIAKVQIAAVTGAPGDGNVSLTKQMKTHLAALGPMVQDDASGADFIVQGNVRMVPIPGGQQRVEIQWSVKKPDGDERGKVVQLNEIPAGSLDHYWADVAVVVATEAAGGVNDVIARQSGREPGEPVRGQAQKPLVEGSKSGVEPVR